MQINVEKLDHWDLQQEVGICYKHMCTLGEEYK